MTHDELLVQIDRIMNHEDWVLKKKYFKALRAVVELHKPIETYNMNNVYKSWLTCTYCNDEMYPCPTVQAIEEQLK